MESDFTVYLSAMTDEQLGLFWIVASPRAKQWIQGELVKRAQARGEAPVASTTAQSAQRNIVAAA